jgi:hypothetical protein
MKKEYWCQDCENSFDIKCDKGLEIIYCPFCGEELSDAYCNTFEDDQD